MAVLSVYSGNVLPFANSAPLATERFIFGGDDVDASNDLDDNLNADYRLGWRGVTGASDAPTVQDFNASMYTTSALVTVLYQRGVAPWNVSQEFAADSVTIWDGDIYIALVANVGVQPDSDPLKWELLTADVANESEAIAGTDDEKMMTPLKVAQAMAAQLIDQTGDYRVSAFSGARTGYVRANGLTIGNASSGATERADDDCEDLFTGFWNEDSSALSVSGGRGASAAADWAANKTIELPDARDNVLAFLSDMGNSDAGRITNFSSNDVGQIGGDEEHTLTIAEMPAHNHNIDESGTGTTGSGYVADGNGAVPNTDSGAIKNKGGGGAHNNMQPTLIAGTLYIKL